MHPSESVTIAAFKGEKEESQLDEKGNVFNTFNMYDIFIPLFVHYHSHGFQLNCGSRGDTSVARFEYKVVEVQPWSSCDSKLDSWHLCLTPADGTDKHLSRNLWWAINWEGTGKLHIWLVHRAKWLTLS